MTPHTIVPTVLAQHQVAPDHEFVATAGEGLLAISALYQGNSMSFVIPAAAHPQLLALLDLVTAALDDPSPGETADSGDEVLGVVEVAPSVYFSAVAKLGDAPETSTFSLMAHGADVERTGVIVALPHAHDLCNVAMAAVSKLAEAAGATKH